jgi:hypothetical protein
VRCENWSLFCVQLAPRVSPSEPLTQEEANLVSRAKIRAIILDKQNAFSKAVITMVMGQIYHKPKNIHFFGHISEKKLNL